MRAALRARTYGGGPGRPRAGGSADLPPVHGAQAYRRPPVPTVAFTFGVTSVYTFGAHLGAPLGVHLDFA
ncbi:hypothetical protein NGM37_40435 [Streptomyces sp. TRM76130]|nr:hypothetical protein [Streptomyces sp. TRM76130]